MNHGIRGALAISGGVLGVALALVLASSKAPPVVAPAPPLPEMIRGGGPEKLDMIQEGGTRKDDNPPGSSGGLQAPPKRSDVVTLTEEDEEPVRAGKDGDEKKGVLGLGGNDKIK